MSKLAVLFVLFPYNPAAGLPPLSDAERFPSKYVAHEARSLGVEHHSWVCSRLGRPGDYSFDNWSQEAHWCWKAYDILEDAQGLTCAEELRRRQKLAELKAHIGEDAYRRGILPPPVPLWRYQWIR